MKPSFMGQAPFSLFEPGQEPRVSLSPDLWPPEVPAVEADAEALRRIEQAETMRAMQAGATQQQGLWPYIQRLTQVQNFWLYAGIGFAVLLMAQGGGGRRRR